MEEPIRWRNMLSAPRDGSRILVTIRASEQGPGAVDLVYWSKGDRFGAELRHVQETGAGLDQEGLLAALSYRRQATAALELYGIAQASLDEQGGYRLTLQRQLEGRPLPGWRSQGRLARRG